MIRKYFEARKLRPYKVCATVLDLRGREIRCCPRVEPNRPEEYENDIYFEMGEVTRIRSNEFLTGKSTSECIQVDNPSVFFALRPGDQIQLMEGDLHAVVLDVEQDNAKIQFKNAGNLCAGGVLFIPGNRMSGMPVLGDGDRENILRVALKNNFDYICVPNITSVKDIQEVKYARSDAGSKLGILAKVDNLEAVHQFEGILKYADGVVVLRNELALELEPEKLMIAQKWMVQTANMASVPIFLQSQVMESMTGEAAEAAGR